MGAVHTSEALVDTVTRQPAPSCLGVHEARGGPAPLTEHLLLCSVGERTNADISVCVESWLEWPDALVGAQGEEDWKTRGKGIWKRRWKWAAGRRSSYPPLRPTRASTVDEALDSLGGKVLSKLVSIGICPEPGLACEWIRKGTATEAQAEATYH